MRAKHGILALLSLGLLILSVITAWRMWLTPVSLPQGGGSADLSQLEQASPVRTVPSPVPGTTSAIATNAAAPMEPKPLPRQEWPYFENATVIAESESPVDEQGYVTRVRVLETDFKYKYVRTTERRLVSAAPQGTKPAVLERRAMVADHVLVQKSEKLSVSEFAAIVESARARVLRAVNSAGLYLIAFDGSDTQALDRVLAALTQAGAGAVEAEPDYIRTLR